MPRTFSPSPRTDRNTNTGAVLASVWGSLRTPTLDRLDTLAWALESLRSGSLEPGTQWRMHSLADRLADSLAAYGFADGSVAVRRAGDLLDPSLAHPATADNLLDAGRALESLKRSLAAAG